MNDKVLHVVGATSGLRHDQNLPLYDLGEYSGLQAAVTQLVNDPSHEAALRNVITAAILFHLEHTEPDQMDRVRQCTQERSNQC